MAEKSRGFFSRRQKVKIPVYLMSFDDFLTFGYVLDDLFSKGQKSEKVLASQQRLAPPLGGGGGSYGTIWYHIMVPCGTICYHMVGSVNLKRAPESKCLYRCFV